MAVVVARDRERYIITLLTDIQGPLILHWGVTYDSHHEWVVPPFSMHPAGTAVFQNAAAQTPFADNVDIRRLTLEIDEKEAPAGILLVLKQSDTGRWIKEKGQNFFIPVAVPSGQEAFSESLDLASIADKIIENEMGRNSWTLMHRFNLCYDLLDRLGSNNVEGVALIYVWLRFSYIRQLDWQRNYNTKPRELGHAISRLTDKLASRYIDEPAERELIRLIMTTLGTGRDAQRVRDEILNIMHRHHIKEAAGHFMEEWHQKLHNNATPDDIVICEAYLEFLASNGNIDLFYKRLEAGGVTRKRLESYERPIKSPPSFIPHLKEALMHDFEHFLEILKEIHSGTDLGTAVNSTRYMFDADMQRLVDYVLSHREDSGDRAFTLLEKITEIRHWVAGRLGEHQSKVRDLLFLDLAMEDFFRAVVEKNLHPKLNLGQLEELTLMSLENLCISAADEEFESCLAYWKRLEKMPRYAKLRPLQVKAVVDRLQRGLGNFIDRYHQLLQPKAESLGKAFHAASWSVSLFTEEVVRGRPAFVLSVLLRKLDALLRKSADLGNWQLISLSSGTGVVETVSHLKSIQGRSFTKPAVVIADDVEGNEEIPEGVIALITPESVDVLSHLAVRARNAHILFAVCYDSDEIATLKSLGGLLIKLDVSAGGEVTFEESREDVKAPSPHGRHPLTQTSAIPKPFLRVYAVPMNEFNKDNTGGKSNNLRRMQGKLPDWINLPASAALPFGVFEKVLAWPSNKELAERHNELLRQLKEETESSRYGLLEDIKKTILALESPDELFSSLCTVMENSGVGRPQDWPEKWEDAWTCIKLVWGSKWNERAYLSRKANGIPDEYLIMAVLVQRVVEADYSFVIHTVNPFTNNNDEIYAEVVLGLGEALVANYPGRALSFSCVKGGREPHLLSFPGKSIGLFGSGLVFRSDSNGEDLAGFAGAGLYDSFMLPQPVKVNLNYTEEALVWDENFRNKFLINIAAIGASVEKVLGGPQDIEGAYTNGQYYVVQSRPQAGLEHD
ncbi:MAG: phosphohistidine-like domain-containing protein [Dissulfurispiraceae bacterium]